MISVLIQTATRTFQFPNHANLTANGRFAAIYTSPSSPLQLLDLATGELTSVGEQVGSSGQFVAEDGTVLAQVNHGLGQPETIELVGPSKSGPLSFSNGYQVVLAGNASRIVYDTIGSSLSSLEIHVFDVGTNTDHYFGPGQLPMLAQDGRHFSYLQTEGDEPVSWLTDTQVWIGDAITGSTRQLSNVPEGIVDQTIMGDGSAVIAATYTGRLLSFDTSTWVPTELLGSPGPAAPFLAPVRGSYNEVVGAFPKGPPEVLIDSVPVPVLGPSPIGYAIQVPWEVPQAPAYPALVLRGSEPLWERQLDIGVQNLSPAVLPVGSIGTISPSGTLGSYVGQLNYGIHQDWSGPITQDNPAHPGEIIHFYGSGWGPVDGTVATGQQTPSDRLYRITTPCQWVATGATANLSSAPEIDVPFAGLAPGLVGVYQLDFQIPASWNDPIFEPFCIYHSGSNTFENATAPVDVELAGSAKTNPAH